MGFTPISTGLSSSSRSARAWALSELSGGLNLEDLEYKLLDNQSPDCLNVWFNNRVLCKRWGTENCTSAALAGGVLAAYPYLFGGKIVAAADTHLYTVDPSLGTVTAVYGGLSPSRGSFTLYNGSLWYINGAQYVRWDGVSATNVLLSAYVPTVCINRPPAGGGNTHATDAAVDDYNCLQPLFKNQFLGDGSAVSFCLTDQYLDSAPVTCTVGGAAKTEGTDFTVNRTTGVVTFNTAPPQDLSGGGGNVVVTAAKTRADKRNAVLSCTQAATFTGENGNRLFFGGNGTSCYYFSDTSRPDYFPYSNCNLVNSNDGGITGFGMQNDTLIVFKPGSIYGVTYSYDAKTFSSYYPFESINSSIGCDCPGTIRLIDNRLTWLHSGLGVFTLANQPVLGAAGSVYRNVYPLSRNVNGSPRASGLLQEAGLKNAVAADFAGKYWLAVNGRVYLWDYRLTPCRNLADTDAAQLRLSWWKFDNLPVTCFIQDGTDLYFGDSSGFIQHFENNYADQYYGPGSGKNLFGPSPGTVTAGGDDSDATAYQSDISSAIRFAGSETSGLTLEGGI